MKSLDVLIELLQPDINYMENQEIVAIGMSEELRELKLTELYGRRAKVVKLETTGSGELHGMWVELFTPHLDETEWYIPIESVVIV